MRILMGTRVVIEASPYPALGPMPASAASALERAFAAIARIDALMHPARAGSDLARINALQAGESVRVDPQTWEVLALAHRLHAATGGVFDPCLPQAPGCMNDLRLDQPDRVSCCAHVALDLGGIAKGYAIDQAVAALIAAGCGEAVVNAGGDLRVLGSQTVWIRTPGPKTSGSAEQRALAPVTLSDAALAVSELESPDRPSGHRGYYRRGAPLAAACTYAAVTAARAAVADALTKCVLLGAADPELLGTCDARVLAARSEQMPEKPVQRA